MVAADLDLNLRGKVALITGGGSGIAEATALLMTKHGVKIGVVGRHKDKLERTCEKIKELGGEGIPLEADISEPEAIKKAVDDLVEHFGQLDLVFANAGVNGVWAPIEELTPEEFKKTMDINVCGTFNSIKYAVPHLKKAGKGTIIITASINGTRHFANSGATAYSASNAAELAMAKMLALELAQSNIRVNCICPGAISPVDIGKNSESRNLQSIKIPKNIPDHLECPLKREPGKPQEVANLVLFLASDMASHITGTEVYVDGGESLIK